MSERLTAELLAAGLNPSPFDDRRFYLFGYGEGAMMAHRLVSVSPDRYAAVYALSGSHGGAAHANRLAAGLAGVAGPVEHVPVAGSKGVSAFFHYGLRDDYVVPTGVAGQIARSPADVERLAQEVGGNAADAFARGDYGANQAAAKYKAHNNSNQLISYGTGLPSASLPGFPFSDLSERWAWVRNNAGGPPSVTMYQDPWLDHRPPSGIRYFDWRDVWQYFKFQPREP